MNLNKFTYFELKNFKHIFLIFLFRGKSLLIVRIFFDQRVTTLITTFVLKLVI